MPDTPTFGRYAEIPVEKMTAEQQAGYRFLVDGPRGRAARQSFHAGAVGAVGARTGDRGARHLQQMGLGLPDELA
jgi:hypothetical protein